MKSTVTMLRERLFSIIRRIVENPEQYARQPGRDFTRKQTLTPAVLIQRIVTMDEKSIWKGLLGHFRMRINTRRRHRLLCSSGGSCCRRRSRRCFTGSLIICVRKRNSGASGCWPRTVRR